MKVQLEFKNSEIDRLLAHYFPWWIEARSGKWNGKGLKLRYRDEDDTLVKTTITQREIRRGMAAFVREAPPHFENFISENDDQEACDFFLQCCVFGKVVYC